jgi:hypothetical protein
MQEFSREEAEELAGAIASVDPDDGGSYFARLGQQLKERGVDLPNIRISYKNFNCVKDAVSSAGALPSLPNVLLWFGKVLPCCSSPLPDHDWLNAGEYVDNGVAAC